MDSTNSLRKEMTLLKNLSKMIEIDGKKYAINISKVLNFLNKYEELLYIYAGRIGKSRQKRGLFYYIEKQ